MDNPIDEFVLTAARSYFVIAVVAVLVGATAAPHAVGFVSDEEQYVAVVTLDESITDATAEATVQELQSLRENESVKAVVLKVSSPGGGAAASEAQYLAVKQLAEEKPVYTSVDTMAASGAYYTIVPSDGIYVKPGSIVGHVGVIAMAPSEGLTPVVTSGPDKAHGGMTQDEFRASIETMKRGFVGAVMNERSDELSVPRSDVAKAKVFIGARAVDNGYADRIGTVDSAIAAAASDAGISDYEVTNRNPYEPTRGGLFLSDASGERAPGHVVTDSRMNPFDYRGVETVQFLMLYGVPEDQEVAINASA